MTIDERQHKHIITITRITMEENLIIIDSYILSSLVSWSSRNQCAKSTILHTRWHRMETQQFRVMGDVSYHHTKDTRLQARKQSIIGIYCLLQVYQTKVFVNPSKASRDYGRSTFSACSFFWRRHFRIFCGIRYSKFILLL